MAERAGQGIAGKIAEWNIIIANSAPQTGKATTGEASAQVVPRLASPPQVPPRPKKTPVSPAPSPTTSTGSSPVKPKITAPIANLSFCLTASSPNQTGGGQINSPADLSPSPTSVTSPNQDTTSEKPSRSRPGTISGTGPGSKKHPSSALRGRSSTHGSSARNLTMQTLPVIGAQGSGRRKRTQSTLFFGDGLYDINMEHSEEINQFKNSVARLRQQYTHTDADTNSGLVHSPEVTWMPSGQKTLHLTVSLPTNRQLLIDVRPCCSVNEVIGMIRNKEDQLPPVPQGLHGGKTAETSAGSQGKKKRHSFDDTDLRSSLPGFVPSSLPSDRRPAMSTGDDSVRPKLMRLSSPSRLHNHVQKRDMDGCNFWLKVAGRAEVFKPLSPIGHYQYVHHCCRFNKHIQLELVPHDKIQVNFARTPEDDRTDSKACRFDGFMLAAETTSISKRGVDVLLDQFSKECDNLLAASAGDVMSKCERVLQIIKAVVMNLASVETVRMTLALRALQTVCGAAKSGQDTLVKQTVQNLRKVVANNVQMYCQAFEIATHSTTRSSPLLVDLSSPTDSTLTLLDVADDFQLTVNVISAHRVRLKEPIGALVGLVYAGKYISPPVKTEMVAPAEQVILDSAIWNAKIDLGPLKEVPREAQIRFILFKQVDKERDYEKEMQSAAQPFVSPLVEGVHALACASVSVFDFNGIMPAGKQLTGLWPYHNHPDYGFVSSNISTKDSYVIQFELSQPAESGVKFPEPDTFETMESAEASIASTSPLKDSADHALNLLMRKGTAEELSDAEKKWVWEQRYTCWRQVCSASPQCLRLFLSAVPSWSAAHASKAHALARSWYNFDFVNALGLLDGRIPDSCVRGLAVQKLQVCPDYLLCDIMPQLLQAVKFDQGHLSSLLLMLLRRAVTSVAVAHRLFWNCRILRDDFFFCKRFDLLHAALLMLIGSALREEFARELHLMERLNAVAVDFKLIPPASRTGALQPMLEKGTADVFWPLRLPLDPSMEVSGLRYEKCSYFSSNAAPLKLTFINSNPSMPDRSCIYKVGDDLRQDQIVLQMLRVMDNLWQEAGLDLRIITYNCLAFSEDSGILEIVDKASTMREIQTIDGVTGSFKDSALLSWLSHHNPAPRELSLAVENFKLSCAGFCVATYVLGVCDRHNDNIMLRRSGHLFHIDFGKFLGNAQKFGSFKRDRTPFVLTPDMAYVINNGEQISPNFQEFVDACCQAFNILRHHTSHLANILTLMRTSSMDELSQPEDVQYVVDALMPDLTDIEAATAFTRMIEESLKNWFTKFNFFIHNLGQMKSSTAAVESNALSFCPRNFTVSQTGAVASASIAGFVRKGMQDTHYNYKIYVSWKTTEDGGESASRTIYRRYREFNELHGKLQELVGQSYDLPQMPGKIILRRSNTTEVATKRMEHLNIYLQKLLALPPLISESDVVCTFFTRFARDDVDAREEVESDADQGQAISGSIKLSLTYRSHGQKVVVVVGHAKQLAKTISGAAPDPYVKVYLIPDPAKTTKKKTRIIKNTQHPTFNESFTLDLSPYSKLHLQDRQLQVTVWHHETLSKTFLGCVHIDMCKIMRQSSEEPQTDWYKLQPMFS